MAKVFNVEQLRINGRLMTGNGSQLFYDSIQLAQGGAAVPTQRTITAGNALEWSTGNDTEDLSDDRTINVLYDDTTIKSYGTAQGSISAESLYVNEITYTHLSPNVAGSGLAGAGTVPMRAVGGSGIQVNAVDVNVSEGGIITSMIGVDAVTNNELAQITEGDKIAGSAVQLSGTTLADDDGLFVNFNSIGNDHLQSTVAGDGLAGGNGSPLSVGAGSGIHVNDNDINIKPVGVLRTMVAIDAIGNDQLDTITEDNKIYGNSVSRYGSTLAVTSNGLHVDGSGIQGLQIHPNVAGAGLAGGGDTNGDKVSIPLSVNAGSGILVQEDDVNINAGGVIKSMLANNSVGNSQVDSSDKISISKTTLAAGAGLDLSTDTLSVGAATNGGITVNADDIEVTTDVVRTLASYNQTLFGAYKFDQNVQFLADVLVTGNLEIRGETILTQSNEVNIGDSIIVLNDDYPSAGSNPPNAGIEIERGAADGGSNGSMNAKLLFDDDRTINTAEDTWVAGKGSNLYQIHTSDFSRSFSVELTSGEYQHKLSFGHTFGSAPTVTVSLQHTGHAAHSNGPAVTNPELLGSLVTKIYDTGVHVDFSAPLPHSGYFLNAYASTI